MTRKLFALSTFALLVVTMSCTQAPKPADTHDADVQALKDIEAQANKDYEAKDLDKLVGFYTDDAVLMAPGAPSIAGKAAIQTMLKQMVADPALSLKFEATRIEVASGGDMAYTQGSYTMTMTDPSTKKPINDKGSYVTVYKKQADGSWKAVSDIASSATPPGPPPAQGK
jgi:uncharacterized protein (TIGR02246 family)